MRILFLMALVGGAAARAEDRCHIEAGPRDVVKQTGDVVIIPGQDVDQVLALAGSVTVKKGASVRSVVAAKGDVMVEGEVRESVVVLAGRVITRRGGVVKGSRIELDAHGVSLKGAHGQSLAGDLRVDGTSLSSLLVANTLKRLEGCVVAER